MGVSELAMSVKRNSVFRWFALTVWALLVVCSTTLRAQDFKRQYKNAKDFLKEGKYNLAMESFKPLLVYDKNNPYLEYASFYYALAALKQGYIAVARDMFVQIKKLYPDWDQQNEVNYWLAKIYFDKGEFFQAMNTLRDVKQEDYIEKEEVARLKRHYFNRIEDPEVLRMLWEEYPSDPDIGRSLARAIAQQPFAQQDRVLLDTVIRAFQLPREKYGAASNVQPVLKDHYNVSLLFPFLTATLDPSPVKKKNQLVLDLYEGMRIANDTLSKMGVNISLLAYDTERDPAVLRRLLDKDEVKNTDLLVGPIFREEIKPVLEFSEKYQVNMINPVSNNSEFVGQNPFSFLYQPSLETLGRRSAELLAKRIRNKNCMVFYGDQLKDSIQAASFLTRAKDLGLNVVWAERFQKETAARIITILATPTEFDEFKNPSQWKLALDSIGSIYVASDNPLIYTKVISSVESRGDSVIIVGSEAWLDNPSVDLNKYEKLHMMLTAPNFTPLNFPPFLDFRKKFIRTHGSFPPEYMNYCKIGYDFMMCIGQPMKQYGVYFQDGWKKDGKVASGLTSGYRLSPQRDNDEFPFIYFRRGEMHPVE